MCETEDLIYLKVVGEFFLVLLRYGFCDFKCFWNLLLRNEPSW